MVKISELTVGQGNVDVEGIIKEVGEIRTFNKFGRELNVANAILEDDSGNIKLTLWNEDVNKFKEGDKIKIINGYVNEFQGEKQLTSGKFGKIEKAEEGENKQIELDKDSKEELTEEVANSKDFDGAEQTEDEKSNEEETSDTNNIQDEEDISNESKENLENKEKSTEKSKEKINEIDY